MRGMHIFFETVLAAAPWPMKPPVPLNMSRGIGGHLHLIMAVHRDVRHMTTTAFHDARSRNCN